MCGIFFSCHRQEVDPSICSANLVDCLRRRGPDSLNQFSFSRSHLVFKFIASVLHLRGSQICVQPVVQNSNLLLWNGEMFNGDYERESSQSDTQFIADQFDFTDGDEEAMAKVISGIEGPFAFIYWSHSSQRLFFGRDSIGRRSLCWKRCDEPFRLSLSSVCHPDESGWEEVPANGIHSLDFTNEPRPSPKLIHWKRDAAGTLADFPLTLESQIKQVLNNQCPDGAHEVDEVDDETVNRFIQVLSDSVKRRVVNFNQLCQQCIQSKSDESCHHSAIGILFSGGLDSSMITFLADRYVPPWQSIDLINVSFAENAPDRLTGLEAFNEIQRARPERSFNFVQVDVSIDELRAFRRSRIKNLVKPLITVLDDSISCAIWFAARGRGRVQSIEYQSPCRVLLLGMGADEQLAGYSRHRSVFQEKGWGGLIDEVRTELARIPIRNLGRDDRIVSDHGKEARFPFLDERVINYLNSLPIWRKANLSWERGKGEKLLLRLAAQKCGLITISGYWKRAIQFGSRIAHLEQRKEKGNDTCSRLDSESQM